MLSPNRKSVWPRAAAATAALAVILAVAAVVQADDGIAYSFGAELELGLCVLSLLFLLGVAWRPFRSPIWRGLRGVLLTACLAGAVVAAYFLNAWALLGAVGLTAVLWLATLAAGLRR